MDEDKLPLEPCSDSTAANRSCTNLLNACRWCRLEWVEPIEPVVLVEELESVEPLEVVAPAEEAELPRLEATSCRKVTRSGLLPDVLLVLPDVLFVPLEVLPPEAA